MNDCRNNCPDKCGWNEVYRGTTPTFQIVLPEVFDARTFDNAYLTFKQAGRTIIEKGLHDMVVDSEEPNVVTVTLTQEDTLALKPANVKYQLRFLIGELSYATVDFDIEAEDILKDGKIEALDTE